MLATYYEPFPFETTRSTNQDAALNNIRTLYNNKEYDKALSKLRPLLEQNNANKSLKMIAGNCHYNLAQTKEAILQFKEVADSNDLLFGEVAKWYLALAYLQREDISKARSILTELANSPQADHQKEAEALLKKLQN